MGLARDLVARKWSFKITKLDTTPANGKLFEFLCKFTKMTIHVYETLTAREPTFVFEWPDSRRVCRLVLTGKRVYSVRLTEPTLERKRRVECRRCRARIVDIASSRSRHRTFCSLLTKNQLTKRREGKPVLRFPASKYRPHLSVVDKLRKLDIVIRTADFAENRNLAAYDCESYSRRVVSKKHSAVWSTGLRIVNTQEVMLISVSYKICDETEPATKLFYVDEHENFVAAFLDFLIDLAKRNADHLRANRFVSYFDQLARLELLHQKNPFRLRAIERAKQALDQLVDQLPVVGFNSGSYDIQAGSKNR